MNADEYASQLFGVPTELAHPHPTPGRERQPPKKGHRRRDKPKSARRDTRCADKVRYTTGAAADRAIDLIRRRGTNRTDSKPQRSYPCPYCNGFHLTAQPD